MSGRRGRDGCDGLGLVLRARAYPHVGRRTRPPPRLAGTLTAGEVNESFMTPAAAADLAFDVTRAGG